MRMRLKKKRKKKTKILNKLIIIILLIVISSLYIIKIFNEKAMPQFISYSELETKKMTTLIINSTVIEEISKNIEIDDLFFTNLDSNGNVTSIDLNSKLANEILVKASMMIEKNLRYVESGEIDKLNLSSDALSNYNLKKLKKGIIYDLPSGVIFNNSILNNILPKIPIRISPIGNIICKLVTDIDEYGINNALVKVSINIEVDMKILLPFTTSVTKISLDVPIIMKIIEGNVPSYYLNGFVDTPVITSSIN